MESGGRTVPPIRLWSLREDVLVEGYLDEDRLVVLTRWGETRIDAPGEVVRESLRRMGLGPISLANVLPTGSADLASAGPSVPQGRAEQGRTDPEWARLSQVLDLLGASVVHSLGLRDGEGPLLSAVPIARDAAFRLPEVGTWPARLSRFAAIRARGGEMLAESPVGRYEVVLHRHLATRVVGALSSATTVADLAPVVGAQAAVVSDIVAYLAAAGIVELGEWDERAAAPRFAADHDPRLSPWSHHELRFHASSRMGRHGCPPGTLFPHEGRVSPALARSAPRGPRFALYRPDEKSLMADPPLSDVVENARPCEEMSDRPLHADQIGELMFRANRLRAVSLARRSRSAVPLSDRPDLGWYGPHELELYVSLHRCAGLPRGVFHYDPHSHALDLVNDSERDLDELLGTASVGAGTTRRPPALITMTARIARSSWMYCGIAYSLVLTHIGEVQQMLSLSATAMGLAGCVPAVDSADSTDGLLRLDWPAEVSVGEFIVGYRQIKSE